MKTNHLSLIKWRYLLSVLASIMLGLFLLYGGGMWLGQAKAEPEAHDPAHKMGAQKSKEEKENKIYQCPMHPQVQSKQAGQTCPICKMDLVQVEAESEEQSQLPAGRAALKLTPYRQQLIGVKFVSAELRQIAHQIRAPGRVAFDPELYTAQNEYLEALRQMERVKASPLPSVQENVKRMIRSAQIRLKILGLSDAEIGALKESSQLSEELLLARKGRSAWIYADVFEMDLKYVKAGQVASISANYLAGEKISGKVGSIDQVINPDSQTAKVRIKVQKIPLLVRPESYVDVTILAPQGEHLAIPQDAVIDTGEETFVFVRKGGGRLEPRLIQVKFRAGEMLAVAKGLKRGEEVVSSVNFLIDSESRLKGVLRDYAANHQS